MSSTFTQTLNSITATKLQVLSKQHADFTSHKQRVLSSVTTTSDPHEKVRLLVDGVKSWCSSDTTSTESSSGSPYLKNVQNFLRQAEHDPGIGGSSLDEWQKKLTQSLEMEAVKFEYAELFGKLLTEWVSNPMERQGQQKKEVEAGTEGPTPPVKGRKEMHEERAKFESYVVVPNDTDTAAIEAYLEGLFSMSKESKNQLEVVRKRIKDFGENLLNTTFTVEDLEWTIKSLLTKDLLPNEKRATLNEFMLNKVILKEVADVLNMHLASLSSWSWPAEGVTIEMRRYLNGKYRNFMEEELLQALFLHFLGVKWAVEFKQAFRQIFESRAWKPSSTPLSKTATEKRQHFLSENPGSYVYGEYATIDTIEGQRRSMQEKHFFMGQLPDSVETSGQTYDSGDSPSTLNPIQTKQTLLYMMTTECLLNTTLYDSFTVVGSDLFSFGSSLSHSSLLTVLKFYGVPETWLTFFERFLSSPLKFTEDGPPQMRKRGVPMAHSLSDFMGEVLLFCMDYAVNQRANGLFLYRLFDDLWFWNSDPEICVKAWKEMHTFSSLVGLEFNGHKTGAVCVGQPLHPDLPQGPIKYGFLSFVPTGGGKFVIDQEQVTSHITELRLQLTACENSVFAWVQVYNKYISSFFITNFGSPPAHCFGRAHIDMVIAALEQIHLELFPKYKGSVTAYLANVIEARFSVRDIPDGWYYWPISMGGLEVKNPFIPLYALRDSICEDPENEFAALIEKDEERWVQLKESWDNGTTFRKGTDHLSFPTDEFLPFEEYAMHREQRFKNWSETYARLLEEPAECSVEAISAIEAALKRVSAETGGLRGRATYTARARGRGGRGGSESVRAPRVAWADMSVYWQWVIACFGEGMVAKWGGLEVVRPGSLPVGMVDAWKSRRMRWDQ